MTTFTVSAPTWDEDDDLMVPSPRTRTERQKRQAKVRRHLSRLNDADYSWHPGARP